MPAFPDNWPKSKKIYLSGTGYDQTDYIVKFNIHRGKLKGDPTNKDIYLDDLCNIDFSDIRFTDINGNQLTHCRAGYGNYEVTYDSRLGKDNWVLANGTIIASGIPGVGTGGVSAIAKSINNGITWTILYDHNATLLFVDSRGYIYANDGLGSADWTYHLLRSIDGGANWTTVLDMSADSGIVIHMGISEDTNGNIYVGQYQNGFIPKIYKSSDEGASFNLVFSTSVGVATWAPAHAYALYTAVIPTVPNGHIYVCSQAGTSGVSEPTWGTVQSSTTNDGTAKWKESAWQHIHGLKVDPYTNYIYAGLDGGIYQSTIRSADEGVTWTVIKCGTGGDVCGMAFANGYRLFGAGGTGSWYQGQSMYRTTDDVTFTKPLPLLMPAQDIKIVGGKFVTSLVTYQGGAYPQIMQSSDGITWETVAIFPFDNQGGFSGYPDFSNPGTPTGETDSQLILGAANGVGSLYTTSRFYNSGNHYQGSFYVRIPALPAAGGYINIWYGNSSAITGSDVATFQNIAQPGVAGRWKLNDGSGTSIADSSGNNYTGALAHTAGKGSWDTLSRRSSGAFLPPINQVGSAYTFNGQDYIEITGSGTDPILGVAKNFTAIAWVKMGLPALQQVILGRGAGNSAWSLAVTNDSGVIAFRYGNGTANTYTAPLVSITDNVIWHMVGIMLDNSATAKLAFIVDGVVMSDTAVINGANALTYDPSPGENPLRIGADSTGARPLIGSVSDVQFYTGVLTPLQVRQLYEDRMVAVVEPARINRATPALNTFMAKYAP